MFGIKKNNRPVINKCSIQSSSWQYHSFLVETMAVGWRAIDTASLECYAVVDVDIRTDKEFVKSTVLTASCLHAAK
jgi:hypothetical protein